MTPVETTQLEPGPGPPPRVTFSAFEAGLAKLPLTDGWPETAITAERLVAPGKRRARVAFVSALKSLGLLDRHDHPTGFLTEMAEVEDRREHFERLVGANFAFLEDLIESGNKHKSDVDRALSDAGASPSLLKEARAFALGLGRAAGMSVDAIRRARPEVSPNDVDTRRETDRRAEPMTGALEEAILGTARALEKAHGDEARIRLSDNLNELAMRATTTGSSHTE